MGRYSKKRKQEEARMRAEDAKKTFVENILKLSEKQLEELERLERRINRKKILINKKYGAAYDKIQKEEREKRQKIFEKYDRYVEKRQNEIKGDLESIEEKKNKISLRQFLLKIILERETGEKTAWTEESNDVAVEAKISISGGTVKSKLRALQSEFIDKFNKVMGTVPGTDIPAYQYLSKNGKNIYLTEDNCNFLRLIMCYNESEGPEYDIVGCAISNNMARLNRAVQDSLKDKPYCPLKNGILYLNKMKLKHHSSKRITFTVLDACYDEDAECPVFDEFLDTITEGREDLKERFMMALGYLLIEPSNGKYFFVMGYAPNSGKSILGNTIQKLYPENSVSNLSLGELGGKFETESLLYSRINISLDLPQEVLNASAVSKLKRITGGDSIEIQRKNQGSLKLDHNMKFLFATNFPLKIDSNDPAFLDRIIFLPFMKSVPKDERDPDLAKKLWKERDAIVTKALQYARKLMKQGWQFPPIPDVDCMRGIPRKNSMDYLKEFLENHCEMGDYNYFTATSDLRRAYEACCDENGTCPCSATAFNKYMEQAGGVRDRKRLTASENPVWGFYGIRLRP